MKNKQLLPMNLQFFAEPGAGEGAAGGSGEASGKSTPPAGTPKSTTEPEGGDKGKTFTRDEVAKMIAAETNKVKTEWEKELEAKQQEAQKLAKMNAEEKLKHQLQQKEDEINELRKQQSLAEMTKEASKMFSESDLPIDSDLLGVLVNEDAEQTKKAVNALISFASKIKKANARQTPPSAGGQFVAGDSKEKSIAELAQENRIIKH